MKPACCCPATASVQFSICPDAHLAELPIQGYQRRLRLVSHASRQSGSAALRSHIGRMNSDNSPAPLSVRGVAAQFGRAAFADLGEKRQPVVPVRWSQRLAHRPAHATVQQPAIRADRADHRTRALRSPRPRPCDEGERKDGESEPAARERPAMGQSGAGGHFGSAGYRGALTERRAKIISSRSQSGALLLSFPRSRDPRRSLEATKTHD